MCFNLDEKRYRSNIPTPTPNICIPRALALYTILKIRRYNASLAHIPSLALLIPVCIHVEASNRGEDTRETA